MAPPFSGRREKVFGKIRRPLLAHTRIDSSSRAEGGKPPIAYQTKKLRGTSKPTPNQKNAG